MEGKRLVSRICVTGVLLALIWSASSSGVAQDTNVQGIVTDEEGKPLKDVRITLADPGRGLEFHLKSDKNGRFIKVGIPPAIYHVSAELEGYFPLESQAQIRFGYTEKITIQLKKIPPQLNRDPDLEEGARLFREGQYDQAVDSFRKVIAKFPSHYEGHFNLGLAYLKKGDFDSAIGALNEAVKLNPQAVDAYFALGEGYFARGESDKATENFSRAIELEPDNARSYYNLGVVLYKVDKINEAVQAFEKAIGLNGEFSSAYYQAALALVKSGDYQKAIRYFEEFLRIEPEAPEAPQVRAMVEELKKKLSPSR